jgi:hypothetical protein
VSQCPQCGASFDPAHPRQRFCVQVCQQKAANARRQTTREGRRAGAPTSNAAPKVITKGPTAETANLFGQWFVRVDGWLALGPMDQAQAQKRADAMNMRSTDNKDGTK